MLSAPFPYSGGKRRIADEVWKRFGVVDVYMEPFFGSGAVLLANSSPARKEVVSDTDGLICNFYRAIQNDPDETAKWAVYPTIHHDLTARHNHLKEWKFYNKDRLSEDPNYYDAKIAGWWVWGISSWIGGGWCSIKSNQIPKIHRAGKGQGIQIQRDVNVYEWFDKLSERLKKVYVLNSDWRICLTPNLLSNTPSCKDFSRAVFLDPPYITDERGSTLYQSDVENLSDVAAIGSYHWAVENGDRYKIAYASYEGDFEVPDGWEIVTSSFLGVNDKESHGKNDCVMFSPACKEPQGELF